MTSTRIRLSTAVASVTGLVLGVFVAVAFLGDAPAAQSRTQRTAIRPENGPNTGLPYSPGILVGDTLYVSGHLGQDPNADPNARRVVPGGIEAETRQILEYIREVLRTAGMDFTDVVSVNAYLTDLSDFARFNEVYRQFFPTDPPARATVGVAALNIGASIEIQMVAVGP